MTTTSSTTSSGTSLLSSYLAKQAAAVSSASASASSSSSTSSTSAQMQEIAGNFETFISVLTTQLKNQDPTEATDTSQFTQELVMFCQVEQQLATNTKLDTMISNMDDITSSSMSNYIGKYIETSSTTSDVVVQNSKAEFAYSLADTASSVKITVTNSSGTTVATMSGPTSSGMHQVEWDGEDSSGDTVDDGTYNIKITETDTSGTTSSVSSIYMIGQVTGVTLDGSASKLSVGDQTVNLSDVAAVLSVGTDSTSSTTASSTSTSTDSTSSS